MRPAILLLVATPLLGQSADLSVSVTAPASRVANGSFFTTAPIRITVTNNGPSDALNVVLTQQLSSQMSLSARLYRVGGAFCAPENDPGVCTVGTLAAGESATFGSDPIIVYVTQQPTPMIATETVTSSTVDPNSANNTASATTLLMQPTVDLYFNNAAVDHATVAPLDLLTYSFTTRFGFPNLIPPSVVSIAVPPGATFVSASPSNSCTGTTTVVCDVGALMLEDHRVLSVTVHAPQTPGVATATATFSSPYLVDPDPANNTASASAVVVAPTPALSGSLVFLMGLALATIALLLLRNQVT